MDHKLLPFAPQDVPRYMSYPTAVQFQDGFPADLADQWLAEPQPADSLSVYMHVPFCQQLCWYCGCHTSVPNSCRRASTYVDSLFKESPAVAPFAEPGKAMFNISISVAAHRPI